EPLLQPSYIPRFLSIWFAGVAAGIEGWGEALGTAVPEDEVEPCTWALGKLGGAVSSSTYLRAWAWLQLTNRQLARLWKDRDLWLTPTTAEPAVPLGTFDAPPDNPVAPIYRAAAFAPFTPPFNASGQPAISLPLHRTAGGLPVGVQLVADYAREDLLIRIAAQLEGAGAFQPAATM